MKRALGYGLLASLALTACGTEDDHDHADDVDPTALFEAAYRDTSDGKADTTGCNGVRVPDQGDFGGRIALTFDDGPDPTTTPKVVETLRAHGAPAAFFMLGKQVRREANADVLKDIVDDPNFIVASHTWSHPNMAEQSAATVARQIDDATQAIADAGYPIKYFRFPYGSSNCSTAQAVRDRGLIVTGWHVDSADWCFAVNDGYCSPRTFRYVDDDRRNDMSGFILDQVKRTNGGVVLFHDTKGYTADALDGVLTALEEAGYTFVGLDDLDTFPQLNGQAPKPTPFVGDGCEADADCDFAVGDRAGFCISGFCSLPCAGYCPDKAGKAATFCIADPDPAIAGGVCVSKAGPINGDCADLPQSIDVEADRYIGTSSAPASTARVCAPKPVE